MYNRYIPQSDGTYRRNQIQEPNHKQSQRPPARQQPQHTAPSPPPKQPDTAPPCPSPKPIPSCDNHAGNFLRQLLPSNLGTEDLLIIILLLLMTGDREEDRNSALLTLALYLFM